MAAFLAHRDSIGDSRSYIRLTLGFLDAWNAIEQPMTFLESPQYWPLSLFFTDPANLDTKQLGLAMAASLWMLLPSILPSASGKHTWKQA